MMALQSNSATYLPVAGANFTWMTVLVANVHDWCDPSAAVAEGLPGTPWLLQTGFELLLTFSFLISTLTQFFSS